MVCKTKSMGSWGSNLTHWSEQTLVPLQQWDGEHHVEKTKQNKTPGEGEGCDPLQFSVSWLLNNVLVAVAS